VNISQSPALAAEHGVLGVPTFAVLDGSGEEVSRLIGSQSGEALLRALSMVSDCQADAQLPEAPVEEGRSCGAKEEEVTCEG